MDLRAMLVLFVGVGCTESLPLASDSPAPARTGFAFPLLDRAAVGEIIGVDHDPAQHPPGIQSGICADYQGRAFPNCYDQHDGTDYILVGGFDRMDADSPAVVAAAGGVVVLAHDGEYDRCRLRGAEVDCDGFPRIPNEVTIEHPDGSQTRYLHLKRDSVAVQVGDQVSCGQELGRIGSSGNSSLPHLHFEVVQGNQPVDPYGLETSLWLEQATDDGLPGAECASLP